MTEKFKPTDIDAVTMASFAWAKGDDARTAIVLEKFINSAAFIIASGARGDVPACQQLLVGSEEYLTEQVAHHAKNVRAIIAAMGGLSG
jgi:hypothetical protein